MAPSARGSADAEIVSRANELRSAVLGLREGAGYASLDE